MSELENSTMRNVFYRNINRLFDMSGKQKKDLAAFVGVSDNTVTSWVKGRKVPRMDKIDMICDFFHVQRRDIITASSGNEKPQPVLSDNEIEIIQKYRSLDERGRANVDALLDRELDFAATANKAEGSH